MNRLILKDCSDITIDKKNVERIKMFGEVVWEKIQATQTTLTISPSVEKTTESGETYYTITKNNTFVLKATVESLKNNTSTIQEGEVVFSVVEEEGNIQDLGSSKIKNGIAELSLTATSTSENPKTYMATFQQTKKYKTSKSIIKIKIQRDTPILQLWGETKVYNGWKVGVKMTASDGVTPLTKKEFCILADGVFYGYCSTKPNIKITNDENSSCPGVVWLSISALIVNQNYLISYFFPGDSQYNPVQLQQVYLVKPHETVALSITGADGINPQNKNGEYQRWKRENENTFSCFNKNETCYQTTNTIATYSGTYRRPHPLTIFFSPITIPNVTKITLKFDANQQPGCNGSYGGALFEGYPSVKLNLGGADSVEPQKPNELFNNVEYYNGYRASRGPVSQTLEWDYTNNGSNPQGQLINTNQVSVRFDFPINTGVEEGFLTLYNVRLIVSYFPPQQTNFG